MQREKTVILSRSQSFRYLLLEAGLRNDNTHYLGNISTAEGCHVITHDNQPTQRLVDESLSWTFVRIDARRLKEQLVDAGSLRESASKPYVLKGTAPFTTGWEHLEEETDKHYWLIRSMLTKYGSGKVDIEAAVNEARAKYATAVERWKTYGASTIGAQNNANQKHQLLLEWDAYQLQTEERTTRVT